jgi:hypothetical protein
MHYHTTMLCFVITNIRRMSWYACDNVFASVVTGQDSCAFLIRYAFICVFHISFIIFDCSYDNYIFTEFSDVSYMQTNMKVTLCFIVSQFLLSWLIYPKSIIYKQVLLAFLTPHFIRTWWIVQELKESTEGHCQMCYKMLSEERYA